MTYKPWTEDKLNDLARYTRSLRDRGSPYAPIYPEGMLVLIEQCRRANRLAEAVGWALEHQTLNGMRQTLVAYFGEEQGDGP